MLKTVLSLIALCASSAWASDQSPLECDVNTVVQAPTAFGFWTIASGKVTIDQETFVISEPLVLTNYTSLYEITGQGTLTTPTLEVGSQLTLTEVMVTDLRTGNMESGVFPDPSVGLFNVVGVGADHQTVEFMDLLSPEFYRSKQGYELDMPSDVMGVNGRCVPISS